MTNGAGSKTETDEGHDARHIFTVDVEEYFQVHAFEDLVHPDEWQCYPSRVGLATDRLLELLEKHDTRATFFVLGWIAERHPSVVERIVDGGHEVASHGCWHDRVDDLTPDQFRADVRRSKEILEDVAGQPVLGYRAPRFSLDRDSEWVLEILAELGFRYDSSVMPARMAAGGGWPDADRWPRIVETPDGQLLELPLTTAKVAGLTLPAAGGAYLRHLPYTLVQTGFRQAEEEGVPGVFYLHPWELDPNQPTIPGGLSARIRHYRNLEKTEERVHRVLEEFDFTSARDRFGLDGPGNADEEREHAEDEAEDVGPERRSRRVGS